MPWKSTLFIIPDLIVLTGVLVMPEGSTLFHPAQYHFANKTPSAPLRSKGFLPPP
jgi:hypothetical protein